MRDHRRKVALFRYSLIRSALDPTISSYANASTPGSKTGSGPCATPDWTACP